MRLAAQPESDRTCTVCIGRSVMEIQEALRIMRALADGVNPGIGEALGRRINRFARNCAGELIFTRSRRRTIAALVRSPRAWQSSGRWGRTRRWICSTQK